MPGLRSRYRQISSENAHMFRVLMPFIILLGGMLAVVHYVPRGMHPMTYHGQQIYPSQLDHTKG